MHPCVQVNGLRAKPLVKLHWSLQYRLLKLVIESIHVCRTMGSELPGGSVEMLRWADRQGVDVRILSDCNSLFINHMLGGALRLLLFSFVFFLFRFFVKILCNYILSPTCILEFTSSSHPQADLLIKLLICLAYMSGYKIYLHIVSLPLMPCDIYRTACLEVCPRCCLL